MRGLGALYMTPVAIQGYAEAAGFFGSDLTVAVAIALAESSGNPAAYNPETAANTPAGQGSYGLWQIYLKVHPEFYGVNLYDPATNAAAAYHVYSQAGGFSPWSTFTSGAYQNYLKSVPLTLDASTGLPVDDTTAAEAPPPAPAPPPGPPIDESGGLPGMAVPAAGDYTIAWILGAAGLVLLWMLES
jgi:Lysozyme like domain